VNEVVNKTAERLSPELPPGVAAGLRLAASGSPDGEVLRVRVK
jgi:hypothetical protein